MSIVDLRASFPSARAKPGKVTQYADTGVVNSTLAGALPALVKGANSDRTYLVLRNIGTENGRYGYFSRTTLNVDGMQLKPGDAVDIDSPGDVYFVSETANPVPCAWDEGVGG